MNFNSLEWLYIRGRGWVAVVDFQGTRDLYDPGHLTGQQVTVDGWAFKVRAVEKHMIMCYPEHPYRGVIGLLVP